MIARITPAKLRGTLRAIPSKSEAHRMLICAALADAPGRLTICGTSEDIDATIRCLNAFGADIRREGDQVLIDPIRPERFTPGSIADCGESGSTLRFLLPVAGALGLNLSFRMHGRLSMRPIAPLDCALTRGGCALSRPAEDLLHISGRLQPGSYELPGNVSSQYITGMLLALSLLESASTLEISGSIESAGYIEMTLRAMARFGMRPEGGPARYHIPGGRSFAACGAYEIEGDWSNAAFWLCAGAFDGCMLEVTGLDPSSAQGDRAVVDALVRMGAQVRHAGSGVRCAGSQPAAHTIDAAAIPDLIPALAAYACANGVETKVIHAERLRIKESDRLMAIAHTLNTLGGDVEETADGLIIRGRPSLKGGEVHAMGDHRIAMMAAIASIACENEVIIHGAEAVNKSYPAFFRDFAAVGGRAELTEV